MSATPETITSLWGEIPEVTEINSVKYLLEEQALALTQATKGLLQGHVWIHREQESFVLTLVIAAPPLDNYIYEVLTATHGIETFPVEIKSADVHIPCPNIEALQIAVAHVLRSERVKKVIRTLLGMMRSANDYHNPFGVEPPTF